MSLLFFRQAGASTPDVTFPSWVTLGLPSVTTSPLLFLRTTGPSFLSPSTRIQASASAQSQLPQSGGGAPRPTIGTSRNTITDQQTESRMPRFMLNLLFGNRR